VARLAGGERLLAGGGVTGLLGLRGEGHDDGKDGAENE
jgi:hypothetical protein